MLVVILRHRADALKLWLENVHTQSELLAIRVLAEYLAAEAISRDLFLDIVGLEGAQAALDGGQV